MERYFAKPNFPPKCLGMKFQLNIIGETMKETTNSHQIWWEIFLHVDLIYSHYPMILLKKFKEFSVVFVVMN